MIKIGMNIGGRYEILEKIGTGGMSDVYKALDHKLNRLVAVKVLKQEFSENRNFVSKFRIEAQAAAGLGHNNIVNVYDVGQENGVNYIVMELVEGITLKKYIEKKVRLTVKESISIAIHVCLGIEAAHNNNIIHRDIKPQNIIISRDGKVKVTDFGIAKAATSNTITSNVMGSVHYTAPEQARGGYSDEKSDIYSMGITMFEMLTGRVPFNGETTVEIAIKHIQDPMPSPSEFVPGLPISIEQIIMKCTQKSPNRRYQNMGQLIDDLKRALTNPDDDFVVIDTQDNEGKTRIMGEEDAPPRKKPVKREPQDQRLRLNDTGRGKASSNTRRQSRNTSQIRTRNVRDDYDPGMERITTVLAVVAAIVIGAVVLFLAGRALGILDGDFPGFGFFGGAEDSDKGDIVEMPDVVGTKLDMARKMLEEAGLLCEVEYVESSSNPQDEVIEASVDTGDEVKRGTKIKLTVSAGADGIDVPNVEGKSLAEATATLEREGFKVVKTESASDSVAKGNVISQSPGGNEKAPRGASVYIEISSGAGSSKVKVPNIIGMSEMDATVTLTEAGLSVGSREEVNNDDPAMLGKVVYQSVDADSQVDSSSTIDIKISKGPAQVTYGFNADVDSPGLEDPGYIPGSSVTVVLNSADGTELMRTNTASFPLKMNVSGITGAGTGVITFIYTGVGEPVVTTDPLTGAQVTSPGAPVEKSVQRAVSFSPEG